MDLERKHFDPDKFSIFLKEQSKLIREQSFKPDQITRIYDHVIYCIRIWQKYGADSIKDINTFSEAQFEFNLAMEIAYSNYRKENKNIWTTIFGWGASKIPQLDINSILLKKNNIK